MPTDLTDFDLIKGRMTNSECIKLLRIDTPNSDEIKKAQQRMTGTNCDSLRIIVQSMSPTNLIGFLGHRSPQDQRWHLITGTNAQYNEMGFYTKWQKGEKVYFCVYGSGAWKMDNLIFVDWEEMKGLTKVYLSRIPDTNESKVKSIRDGKEKLNKIIPMKDKLENYTLFLQSQFGYTKYKISKKLNKIADKRVRDILKRDIETAVLCLMNKFWKPCVIVCGGIIEGLLMDKLQTFTKLDLEDAYKKTYPTHPNKPFSQYVLANFINVSVKLGVLEDTTGKTGHGIRDYRNYIHPIEESKQKYPISENDANISSQFIFKLLNELY